MSELHNSGALESAGIPQETQRNWNRIAEGLFGSALSRPDIYQRVTTIIGLTATLLRDRHAGAEELLAVCDAPDNLIADVLAANPHVSLEGLDAAQLVAGACAMRYREVVEESAALARKNALAAGEPDEWVVLAESGPSDGDPFLPYRRLEGHRATGLAIAVGTRPDDSFTDCIHSVDVLRIDPASGALGSAPVGTELSFECVTAAEREENADRIKHELLVSGNGKS